MKAIRRSTLENGIRVVTDAMPGVRAVSIGVLIDAGPRQEEPGASGLAHLCEHLLFQGTSSRSALEIARVMDLAGGQFGAFTSRDYTCLYGVVLDDYRTFAIDLMGDVLLNSTFPQEAVESEKRAILCEIEASVDDPEARAHHMAKAQAWGSHALGRRITGEVDSVRALDREQAIYFAHRHYCPKRIIISAAGNVNHQDFVAQVRDSFWRMQPQNGEPPTLGPPRLDPGVAVAAAGVSQAYFSLGFEVPQYAHPDRFSLHVLTQVLGGGISSRLFSSLRERRGLAYNIHSSYHGYRDTGILLIEGSTSPCDLAESLELCLGELRTLARLQRRVDAEELRSARARLTTQVALASADSHSRMSRLATQEFYFGTSFSEAELVDDIEGVDSASLDETCNLIREAVAAPALAIVVPEAAAASCAQELEPLVNSRFGSEGWPAAGAPIPTACRSIEPAALK